MSYPRPLLRLRYPQATARLRVCAQAISPCIRRPLSTEAKRALRTDKLRTSSIPKRYFVYLFTLSLGLGAGLFVRTFANARFDPPIPGSEEDAVALEALGDQMEELKVVKALRGQGYQVNRKSIFQGTGNQTGGWVELDTQQDINKGITRTLTEQAVAGIQGLGVQRAFWNSQTRELVGVIWIGPRLSGWPGLAHGGAIATVFEDAMSMMIAGPHVDRDSVPAPASMSVTYAQPTQSFNIYILRTSFSTPDIPQVAPPAETAPAKSCLPSRKDFTKQETSTKPGPPVEVSGTLEDLEGKVLVRAKGIWPASIMDLGSE